jgi:hypothetical protein
MFWILKRCIPVYCNGYDYETIWWRIQKWDGNSREEEDSGWFCGVGLKRNIVPPGRAIFVPVQYLQYWENIRIGINYYESDKTSDYRTVWTGMFSLEE